MKKFVGLAVLLLVVVAAISACKDDVIVEPPPSLTGDYTGTYTIRNSASDQTEEMVITWRFTGNGYIMRRDADVEGNPQICCNSAGNYELGNNVELSPLKENLDAETCNPDKNPTGTFAINQSIANKVILTQDSEGLLKTLELDFVQ